MKVEMALESKSCPTCGIVYAVPADWFAALYRQHDRGDQDVKWFCPNGHVTVFGAEGKLREVERERNRLKQENARLEQEVAEALLLAEQAELAAAQAKEEAARGHRRAVAGVCPCCNRSFHQLAQHMRTKHPGQYADQIHERQSKGGKARAANLPPDRRSEIAKAAARKRWRKEEAANG